MNVADGTHTGRDSRLQRHSRGGDKADRIHTGGGQAMLANRDENGLHKPALLPFRKFTRKQEKKHIAEAAVTRELFDGIASHQNVVWLHLRDGRRPEFAHGSNPVRISSKLSATNTFAFRSAVVFATTDP